MCISVLDVGLGRLSLLEIRSWIPYSGGRHRSSRSRAAHVLCNLVADVVVVAQLSLLVVVVLARSAVPGVFFGVVG